MNFTVDANIDYNFLPNSLVEYFIKRMVMR